MEDVRRALRAYGGKEALRMCESRGKGGRSNGSWYGLEEER